MNESDEQVIEKYLSLPLTKRFEIAKKLNLLEAGESSSSTNADQITALVLVRAKQKGIFSKLYPV